MHEDELLTPPELAEMLKVPVSWIYARTRRRRGDRLPHIRLGKYIRFIEADVYRYLERQKEVSGARSARLE
jgi:excisionase family DNA binding protein